MAELTETYRAVVFPWHCDHNGHMNVRWYAHHFDDAGFHLWSVSGLDLSKLRERGINFVVAGNATNFIDELKAGELLVIKSGFVELGNRSLKAVHHMYNADTGALCATHDMVLVGIDAVTRKSAAMPDEMRERLSQKLVSVDRK